MDVFEQKEVVLPSQIDTHNEELIGESGTLVVGPQFRAEILPVVCVALAAIQRMPCT
jgi:hypothetical protein